MAVLHALLRGEPAARGRDELAPLLAKHSGWLDGRKFLLVPYHLLDARSLEQRVLGGYVDHVRTLHPDAPIPAVHRTDALLEQARQHARARRRRGVHRRAAGRRRARTNGATPSRSGPPSGWTQAFAGAHSDDSAPPSSSTT